MSKIKVRKATLVDIEDYIRLQAERWSEGNTATIAQLKNRLAVHPDGMLVAERDGEVVGMVYAMRISSYDLENSPSWYEITDNGMCSNHDPNGPIIFGVDLSTAKGVGAEAGDLLLIGIAQLAIEKNVKWAMLGGRMPGYHEHKEKMTATEYLRAKNAKGRPLDRQVNFYTKIPGLVALKVLPNYFEDPESCDYGVLLRWKNPFYNVPFSRIWAGMFPKLYALEEKYIAFRRMLKRR